MTFNKKDNKSLLYSGLHYLQRQIVSPILYLNGYRIKDKKKLPQSNEAFIIICNHAKFIDSLYLQSALRQPIIICGAKPKYFRSPWLRFLLKLNNIMKVENEQQFKQDCCHYLSQNRPILIYPEMGRNPEGLGEFITWAAEVALESNVPVYPCYLYGTSKNHQKPCRLIVGDVIYPKGTAMELTHQFKEVIQTLGLHY